ncbi:ATP-binding protein [Sorangium sp. So ce388]|uniref:ATP-binding protein n=1 Tax=Sorangium sp. So ce388 TaxID=3133309 RepID=UPI003F5C8F2B
MSSKNSDQAGTTNGQAHDFIKPCPPEVLSELDEIAAAGRAPFDGLDPELAAAVGFSHFDTSSSEDNLITVLLARDDLHRLASQTLVRIQSREDDRSYLGVVVRGPFAEPDAVSPNSVMAVSVVVQGKKLQYTFDYHGRAEVEILGEKSGGNLIPPRYRPRPKSPVYVIDEAESSRVLGVGGDLCLGQVVGYQEMEARIPSKDKAVLPRHTGVIGTTGGGKSTTVASLIHGAQEAGIAAVVFDVEGEYTHVDEPTEQGAMLDALKRRGLKAQGVRELHIHHLVGRETTNQEHKSLHPFALKFSSLSPHAIAEILEMSDAQLERFIRAYDVTKLLLRDFQIFPANDAEERDAFEVDELTTGYPRMTIQHLIDVVNAYIYTISNEGKAEAKDEAKAGGRRRGVGAALEAIGAEGEADVTPASALLLHSEFKASPSKVRQRVAAHLIKNEISWKALAGKLHRLQRLGIFDVPGTPGADYASMLTPGRVSVIDLSDTDSPQLNNLVIADLLRGLQDVQEERYRKAAASGEPVVPTLIIIEEAHEFLSAQRIHQMPVLFQQVARIAKRGRKRWLGLVFVTQLPQHLPNEVLGLLNNFIIHRITDSAVIHRMQKTVGSIDESLWNRVPRLAPGQALVSFASFARPLMVAIDPAPCKRLLVE